MSNSSVAASNEIPRGFLVSQIIVSLLLSTPAVFTNIILLITIYRRKLWRITATLLVVNLSVCDFLTGLISGYGSLYYDVNLYLGQTRKELLRARLIITFSAVLTNVVASCNIAAMAIDRLLAVSSPLHYKARVTPKKIKVFIAIIWTYSVLFSSLAMVLPQNVFVLLYCHLHVSLPIIALSLVYWKTFRALRSHNEQLRNIAGGRDEQMTAAHRDRERKMISAFLMVLILFYVTFAPQYIAQNMLVARRSFLSQEGFRFFLYVGNKLLLVNSILNPFIYAWRIPRYRKAFTHEFGKFRLRKKCKYDVTQANRMSQMSSADSDPTQESR